MKRYFLLSLVILPFVFVACSSDDSSSSDEYIDREYSKTYKGVYLTTINGEKKLCYADCDKENLRKYVPVLSEAEEDDIFCKIKMNLYIEMEPSWNPHTSNYDYFDIFRYDWHCCKSIYCQSQNTYLSFRLGDKGFVNFVTPAFQRYYGNISNSFGFLVFKIYSENDKMYFKIMFFDTKEESSVYGDNFENLTVDDFILKSEKVFLYIPRPSSFILAPVDFTLYIAG